MNKQDIIDMLEEIGTIHNTLWEKQSALMDKNLHSYDAYFKAWSAYSESGEGKELWNKLSSIKIKLIQDTPKELIPVSTKPTGDIFTTEEFTEDVLSYGFIDSDGSGCLILDGKEVDFPFYPSLIREYNVDISRYDGVSWYNK